MSKDSSILVAASKLLDKFETSSLSATSQMNQVISLLQRFRTEPTLRQFQRTVHQKTDLLVQATTRVISTFHQERPIAFNPFLSCGFDPTENDFTVGLTTLMDPQAPHGLGKLILTSILKSVRVEATYRNLDRTIDSIACALNASNPQRIRIERNYYHRIGRPDIVVIGTDASRFIIAIENKAPGGKETLTIHGVQTDKYYESILKPLADKWQVARNCLLAIFLTPEGANASHPNFLPLSSNDLAHTMLQLLSDQMRTAISKRIPASDIVLAHAFMTTFAWLNQGGMK